MSTIHPDLTGIRSAALADEIALAAEAAAHGVRTMLAERRAPRRPQPLAFLDDGRRVFLLVDAGRGRPVDQPRSWGIEVTRDGDLVGDGGTHLAFRSTQPPTAQAAERATRFLLEG